MGYRKVPTIHTLKFDEYDGLEVRMKNIKIGKMRKVLAVMESDEEGTAGVIEQMVAIVGEGLVSWTMEDEDGVPIPATVEEVDELDFPMLSAIVNEWLDIMTGPGKDLGKDSPSGEKFPGQPLTMEAL